MAIRDEYLPLDSLLPDTANYNQHAPESIALLASQIVSVGFTAPFLIDANTRLIAAGHRRRLALFKLRADGHAEPEGVKPGWQVPCRVGDWSEIQRLKVLIGDNPDPARIDYDGERLTALLSELSNAGELDGSGYDEARLEALIGELAATGEAPDFGTGGLREGVDPDEVPEAASVPQRCQPGDLWQLGRHRLLIGDCRDAGNWERLLQGERVNVVVTSPPYASQRKYDEESGFRPIPPAEYGDWYEAVQANIRKHLADDGSYFLNIKEHCEDGQRHLYVKDLTLSHVRAWGWRFVDEFCWRDTRNGVPGGWNNRFKDAWEPVFHFARGGGIKFRPEAVSRPSDGVFDYSPENEKAGSGSGLLGAEKAGGYREGLARPSNVLEVPAQAGVAAHTAPFPVALAEFFLKAFSDPDDIALDPFMGSGTTLMAAEQNSRQARGFEVSAKYGDVILYRWEAATGQTAELLERLETS